MCREDALVRHYFFSTERKRSEHRETKRHHERLVVCSTEVENSDKEGFLSRDLFLKSAAYCVKINILKMVQHSFQLSVRLAILMTDPTGLCCIIFDNTP